MRTGKNSRARPETTRPVCTRHSKTARAMTSTAKKGQRPIARPGNFSCLRHECQQSHRENEDARPVMVVLGPSFFGRSVRACSSLARNVGLGGERTYFEGSFLRGVNVFGELLN